MGMAAVGEGARGEMAPVLKGGTGMTSLSSRSETLGAEADGDRELLLGFTLPPRARTRFSLLCSSSSGDTARELEADFCKAVVGVDLEAELARSVMGVI